jgi:hypothetical protein
MVGTEKRAYSSESEGARKPDDELPVVVAGGGELLLPFGVDNSVVADADRDALGDWSGRRRIEGRRSSGRGEWDCEYPVAGIDGH